MSRREGPRTVPPVLSPGPSLQPPGAVGALHAGTTNGHLEWRTDANPPNSPSFQEDFQDDSFRWCWGAHLSTPRTQRSLLRVLLLCLQHYTDLPSVHVHKETGTTYPPVYPEISARQPTGPSYKVTL